MRFVKEEEPKGLDADGDDARRPEDPPPGRFLGNESSRDGTNGGSE